MNAPYSHEKNRSWAEINLNNLTHNAKVLTSSMPNGCKLMAVIKADAYGHGMIACAEMLALNGIDSFGVATLDEGIALRESGINGEILIMSYTDACYAKDIAHYDLSQLIPDIEYAKELNENKFKIKGHIKIDTGMHRLGFPHDNKEDILKVFSFENISVCGICTHLSSADGKSRDDIEFTDTQIKRFYDVIDFLKESSIKIPPIHIQSSYGLLSHSDIKCDIARIGLALYGVPSTKSDYYENDPGLLPVMTLKSRITYIRDLKKGEPVSYGRDFYTERDSKIAILAIGYADGYPRNLSSGKGVAIVNGVRVPVVGRICMDQMAIDVTDVPNVKSGDIATLIGDGITAHELAERQGSITNELLCRIGQRIPRIFK